MNIVYQHKINRKKSDGDDFDFLVSYIKLEYKIFRRNQISLKDSALSGDVISCYIHELVVSSKKENKILNFILSTYVMTYPSYVFYFALLKHHL